MADGLGIETVRENARRFVTSQRARAAAGKAARRLFDSPEGKTVLAYLAREGFLLGTTAVAGDEAESHRNEGSRILLLKLIELLRWSDAEVMALAQERTVDQIAAAMEPA